MIDVYQSIILEIVKRVNKPSKLENHLAVNITPKRFKIYVEASLTDQLKANEQLLVLENANSGINVTLDLGSFGEEVKLKSIFVNDARTLLTQLKIPVQIDIIADAISKICECDVTLPQWVQVQYDDIEQQWQQGKKQLGCSPKDYLKLIDAKLFITFCESADMEVSDIRTVSAKLYRDTKRLEKIEGLITRIYQDQLPEHILTSARSTTVLSYLGVHRYPPVFRTSGPLEFSTKKGKVSAQHAWPYLGMPPDGITGIKFVKQPTYVLFIENQTTFERYCRHIDDGGLIFYTNGFPSRQWQRLFRDVARITSDDISFYHWGDLDVGGYRILCFVQQIIDRPLIPYRMLDNIQFDHISTYPENTRHILIKELLTALEINTSNSIQSLKQQLLDIQKSKDTLPWIEQEYLTLSSPLLANRLSSE